MKSIQNKAKGIIREEHKEVSLPNFSQNPNGEYEMIGIVDVSTLKELKKYISAYKKIYKIVKENYKKEISEIYRQALSTLVKPSSADLNEDMGASFNDDEYSLHKTLGSELSKRSLVRILNADAFDVKRFRPGKEIVALLSQPNENGSVILPRMTENGIVALPNKNMGSISLMFDRYLSEDADKIKKVFVSAANEIEDKELKNIVVSNIEELFDAATYAATESDKNGDMLSKLANMGVKLMGVDLSAFRKRPTAKKVKEGKLGSADFDAKDKLSSQGKSENEELHNVSDDMISNIDESENSEEKIISVIIEGTNLINQAKKEGNVVTVISPLDESLSYKLTIENGSAMVKQVSSEPQEKI